MATRSTVNRAVFVSDIHISSPEDPKFKLLLELLEACASKEIGHLFFVGDIFDFWIADRKFLITAYSPLVDRIRNLVEAGVRVHYFEGNHDLDLRRFWQDNLGASVHTEAAYFHIGTTSLRVEHGDQMNLNDRGYRFLRWLLRTRLFVWLGRYLPEFVIRWLGARASTTSRTYTSTVKALSDDQVRETVRRHARWAYSRQAFDVFVSGHVHVTEDSLQSVGEGTFKCINLGTWLKKPMLLEIQDGEASLRPVEELL